MRCYESIDMFFFASRGGFGRSLGSNCGELPLPLSENEGPTFRLDGEVELVEFDVTVQADVSELPLEVERYSHALIDLVPSEESEGLARVRVYDRWSQVVLDREVLCRRSFRSVECARRIG